VQFGRWWKNKRRFCTVGHCKVDRRSARMCQLNALHNSVRNMDSARQSAKAVARDIGAFNKVHNKAHNLDPARQRAKAAGHGGWERCRR
jgi:hypothetical protein